MTKTIYLTKSAIVFSPVGVNVQPLEEKAAFASSVIRRELGKSLIGQIFFLITSNPNRTITDFKAGGDHK
jgi:hypothetical protein